MLHHLVFIFASLSRILRSIFTSVSCAACERDSRETAPESTQRVSGVTNVNLTTASTGIVLRGYVNTLLWVGLRHRNSSLDLLRDDRTAAPRPVWQDGKCKRARTPAVQTPHLLTQPCPDFPANCHFLFPSPAW